jgi:hypothetical protein
VAAERPWPFGPEEVLKSPRVTQVESGTPGADPEMEDREKRSHSLHFRSQDRSSDEWIAVQERWEQKRRLARNRQARRVIWWSSTIT